MIVLAATATLTRITALTVTASSVDTENRDSAAPCLHLKKETVKEALRDVPQTNMITQVNY